MGPHQAGTGLVAALLVTAALAGEGRDAYLPFEDPRLAGGRAVWLVTCEGCHGYGVADAPIPMQPEDWAERVGKERTVLYHHALNDLFGPGDTYMPAKGGNAELSDEQVRQAVDYMVTLALNYLRQTEDRP
jgi:cytochrome c5